LVLAVSFAPEASASHRGNTLADKRSLGLVPPGGLGRSTWISGRRWCRDQRHDARPVARRPVAQHPGQGPRETAREFPWCERVRKRQKDVDEATAREAERASELAKQGHLIRLWVLPAEHGVSSALGLWRAGDAAEMGEILRALPLSPYLATQTTPLTPHPSDPAAPGSRERIEADHG
jgi:muconolactone delta-isomerase